MKQAGEVGDELTFDYCDGIGEGVRVACLCRHEECRGYVWFLAKHSAVRTTPMQKGEPEPAGE
eukprot:905580-Rhodomonas_salina.1